MPIRPGDPAIGGVAGTESPTMHRLLTSMLLASLIAAVALVTGCGDAVSGGAPGETSDDGVRTVRVILPLDQDGDDMGDWRAAMELAVEEHGSSDPAVRVEAEFVNDSKPNGEEDPDRAGVAAKAAVADPRTLAVVGPASSSAAAVAAPILNRAGMLQVLMSSTAVSLTVRDDALPGPPSDIAPTGHRTIVRIVPSDRVQARALLDYLREEGIRRVTVVDDGGRFGTGLAADIMRFSRGQSPAVTREGTSDREHVAALARGLALENAGTPGRWALLMAVNDQEMAVNAAKAIQQVDSTAAIAGPDSLTFRGFLTGVGTFERNAYVTTFQLPVQYYGPAGDRVSAALEQRLGHAPAAGSLFSYEAMALAISSIDEAYAEKGFPERPLAAQRRAVTKVALQTTDRGSVIGTYSITATGDTSNTLFGAYRVEDGTLVRGRAVDTGDIR